MVATYIPGKRRSLLRYCQIYKSPRSKSGEKQLHAQIGHAVVLIGAGMKRGRVFFYFLNSWGEKFCPRKNNQGEIVTGGIGKLREDDLTKIVVRLSPPGETGNYFSTHHINLVMSLDANCVPFRCYKKVRRSV